MADQPPHVLHVLNYGWPYVDGYTIRSAGLITAQRRHLGLQVSTAVSPFSPFARGRDEAFVTEAWGPHDQIAATAYAGAGRPIGQRRWERPGVGLAPRTAALFRRELASIVRRVRPDVVHAHHPHYVAHAALQVARHAGIPCVYEIRCLNGDYDLDARHPYYRLRGHWQNALERAALRLADHVVTIGDGLARRLVAGPGGVAAQRLSVVRNSVDTERFRAGDQVRRDAGIRIGYATTFERIENLDAAVRGVALAAARGNPARRIKLVLAGTGRDWDRIRAQVASQGLEDLVELPGFVPYSRMPEFYRSLDLFLVPRGDFTVARDTTPLKPLEAAACGLPLLVTDLPAMRELFGEHAGVRYTAPTAEAIAAGVGAFLERPWSGGIDVSARSWQLEVQRYRAVYAAARAAARDAAPARGRSAGGVRRLAEATRARARTGKLQLQQRGWLTPLRQYPLRHHVVVCGFPRSGSTLLQLVLEASVGGLDSFSGEVEALDAVGGVNRRQPFLLTKCPEDVVHLEQIRQRYAGVAARPLFVITLRDPRDVLTSRHAAYPASRGYYVEVERWRRLWRAIRTTRGCADVLWLRYEDLVRRPAEVQSRLEAFVGWPRKAEFASFHERSRARDSMTEGAIGGLRPFDAQGLERWRAPTHCARLVELLRTVPELPEALRETGYEPDDRWAERYRCRR